MIAMRGLLCFLALGAVLRTDLGTPRDGVPQAERFPRNVAEFDQMFDNIKTWGKWGVRDELGAANLITDEKRRQAISSVKLGRVIGLGHPLITTSAVDNPSPLKHMVGINSPTLALDGYQIFYHGPAHSHLDALCHIFYRGTSYNGYPQDQVVTATGCAKLGVEQLVDGLVTRGVIIDIPRLRRVPYLEPGTAIFVEDIERWERATGTHVSPGDAVLFRTGRWLRRKTLGPWDMKDEAGLHASVARWLKDRGVAAVGSDDGLDVSPSMVAGVELPVHELAINALGIAVLDNIDLEELAKSAEQRHCWEFLLTVSPMVVVGGTGSPVDPLAIF